MKIIYRRARRSDWDSIVELIAKFPRILLQHPLPKWRDFFVAESNGRVIACAALDPKPSKLAEIRSVAVPKRYSRRGVGTKLASLCIERARKRNTVDTVTIAATLTAAKMFRRLGLRSSHKGKQILFLITGK